MEPHTDREQKTMNDMLHNKCSSEQEMKDKLESCFTLHEGRWDTVGQEPSSKVMFEQRPERSKGTTYWTFR